MNQEQEIALKSVGMGTVVCAGVYFVGFGKLISLFFKPITSILIWLFLWFFAIDTSISTLTQMEANKNMANPDMINFFSSRKKPIMIITCSNCKFVNKWYEKPIDMKCAQCKTKFEHLTDGKK